MVECRLFSNQQTCMSSHYLILTRYGYHKVGLKFGDFDATTLFKFFLGAEYMTTGRV